MAAVTELQSELVRAKDLGAVDLWALPSFDPELPDPPPGEEPEVAPEPEPVVEEVQVEEVAIEEVQPLTLEEVEAIRQEAYNEGFSTGEKDGFHSGQLKAKQEADAALAVKVASLETLMSHLFEPIAEQDKQIEAALMKVVSQVVREVVRRELQMDSTHVAGFLREALKLLPAGAQNLRIHVNPQDFDTIKALRERHEESWRILEDTELMPGGCRIETDHSRIDATVETRLEQALDQLFEQQRLQAVQPAEPDLHIDLDSPDAP